jgi:hypothetical protein
VLLLAACRPTTADRRTIRFTLPQDGIVSIQVTNAGGSVFRVLAAGVRFAKGPHSIDWDGRDDRGEAVEPGEYRWEGVVHDGIGVKLRGWACSGGDLPWEAGDAARRGRAGEVGAPSAVCADAERVYLGWSAPVDYNLKTSVWQVVVACDLEGHPLWSAALSPSTGCRALAVDNGVVTVLGRKSVARMEKDSLFRLNAADGSALAWPGGQELPITALWPAESAVKPECADGMAMRAGRLYLTFTEPQFLAVLDAVTGAYLQTVVGAAPELIDVVTTKTESSDQPGELIAADFAMISLRGGVLGKVLFAHDPLWVVVSDLQPLDQEEHISALTLLGDGAKHHQHSVFVGLDAPFHQVQRRSILASEGFVWSAGIPGGRPDHGVWNREGVWRREALGPIRGLALDSRGRLWVAEGDRTPPRFSVWDTDGKEGRLVREFFGPVPNNARAAAVLPTDPNVMVGAGCEWRIDPQTGQGTCLGVITWGGMTSANFVLNSAGASVLRVRPTRGPAIDYQRRGEGDYVRIEGPLSMTSEATGSRYLGAVALPGLSRGVHLREGNGVWEVVAEGIGPIARLFESDPALAVWPQSAAPGADMTRALTPASGSIMQTSDGRVYAATGGAALWNLEITGLETVRSLPGGKLTIATPAR